MSKPQPNYGDPLDYPDIPPNSGLGEAYRDAVTPDHVKEAIAKRKGEREAHKERQVPKRR